MIEIGWFTARMGLHPCLPEVLRWLVPDSSLSRDHLDYQLICSLPDLILILMTRIPLKDVHFRLSDDAAGYKVSGPKYFEQDWLDFANERDHEILGPCSLQTTFGVRSGQAVLVWSRKVVVSQNWGPPYRPQYMRCRV